MNLDEIWQDYGLDELQAGMDTLFPKYEFSLMEIMQRILAGDLMGTITDFLHGSIAEAAMSVQGLRNVFVWLLVLGVLSALLSHFVEVFDRNQVADLSFYFVYLLMTAILLKCFGQSSRTAVEAIENIVLFIRLLVPTYLLAVGVCAGTVTVGAYYQLIILLIYGVEAVLLGVVLPLIYSYCLLAVVNGIWIEERLSLFIELLEKMIGWILKASLGVVTGIGILQSVIAPVVDSVKAGAFQKAISAIPGIGNTADGVVELVIGSAVVVKNSIGVVLLILLLFLCAAPLMKIFLISLLVKCAAAFMGIVSDKRITSCANRTGDAGLLLFRATGTAMLLFLIAIAILATTTNRGF